MLTFNTRCENCDAELKVESRSGEDWVKVICSRCGRPNMVSLVRERKEEELSG